MSDAFWIAMFGCFAVVSPVAMTIINQWFERARSEKVEAVRVALVHANVSRDEKLAALATVAADTHRLVNGGMKIQLKAYALLAHRLADETGKASDLKAAQEADEALAEHEASETNK